MIEELEREIRSNSKTRVFLKKLKDGKATQEDVSLYASDLGECVAAIINRSISSSMTKDDLENLALPLFKEVHEKVIDAASTVQVIEDKKNGIGIKPVKPEFPYGKINGLISKIFSILKEQEDGS